MVHLNLTYNDRSGLILCFGWDFQTIRIVPENLSLNKVDAMFFLVCLAFKWIKLEIHNGIINIPLWQIVSMRHLPSFAGLRSTERVEGATGVSPWGSTHKTDRDGNHPYEPSSKGYRRRRANRSPQLFTRPYLDLTFAFLVPDHRREQFSSKKR